MLPRQRTVEGHPAVRQLGFGAVRLQRGCLPLSQRLNVRGLNEHGVVGAADGLFVEAASARGDLRLGLGQEAAGEGRVGVEALDVLVSTLGCWVPLKARGGCLQTYDTQLPQQRQQLFFLLARNCRVVALVHRWQRIALTLADIVDFMHILCKEVRKAEAPEPALLVDLIYAGQCFLQGNHVRSMDVVDVNLLHDQKLLTPVSKALHALCSHGAWNDATRSFGVNLEAFAAVGLAEDLFACAVDVGGVDFADASFFQGIVDFE